LSFVHAPDIDGIMTRDHDTQGVRVSKLSRDLARKIGEHKIVDDPDLLAELSKDESHAAPCMPDLAVRAGCAEDVLATLELAEKHGVPVVARGGGTGKSGGAIPAHGGVVLDLRRVNRIVEIDRENLVTVAEPGVITGALQAAVEAEGLFYPPDPNSLETCTLGGNAAHNAGGPRAFKYGVTREYVLGARVALMGGRELRTGRRTVKGVAGYDLTALLVGSEGTLGVFTELTLRLVRNPPSLATLLVRMPDEVAAGRAVARIVADGLVPRVIELMDAVAVDTLRAAGAGGVPESTGALLLIEVDGLDAACVERDASRIAALADAEGAVEVLMARHGGEREKLWAARRSLSDALKKRARFKVSEDIAVPRAAAPRLLVGLRAIAERRRVLVPTYGHAGDGNYHVNVLWDDEGFDAEPVLAEIFGLALSLGGTITGEHGVGLTKRAYLGMELDPASIALQKELKRAFDPKGLMNPGKIFL
jgi:glycolate oxidase